MTLKEEFDAVQKRISRVLTALELARLEASQQGERFFLAGIYVGIAYEAAFSAVKQLRDDTSKMVPPIASVDYESFEFYAKRLAGKKKLKSSSGCSDTGRRSRISSGHSTVSDARLR